MVEIKIGVWKQSSREWWTSTAISMKLIWECGLMYTLVFTVLYDLFVESPIQESTKLIVMTDTSLSSTILILCLELQPSQPGWNSPYGQTTKFILVTGLTWRGPKSSDNLSYQHYIYALKIIICHHPAHYMYLTINDHNALIKVMVLHGWCAVQLCQCWCAPKFGEN